MTDKYIEQAIETLKNYGDDIVKPAIHNHHILSAIEGSSLDLFLAFSWRRTPQGLSYWSERYNDITKLTEDDIQFLKALVVVNSMMGG